MDIHLTQVLILNFNNFPNTKPLRMLSKEYKRLYKNEYISWKAFDKITDECQGKSVSEIKEIENSPRYLKALKRFLKWHNLFIEEMKNPKKI